MKMECMENTLKLTEKNIEMFAFTNRSLIKGDVKAIVLDFHGLGDTRLRKEASQFEIMCAEENVLTVFPYYGPWSWMNPEAVRFVDAVVDACCKRDSLDINSVPIISSGGSMGGLSALIYTRYAKITPKACFANCPVCDLVYHATERDDLPRTIYYAFKSCDCGIEQAIINNSPYHQTDKMPDIPYFIIHGTEDTAVNINIHSDRFVEAMRRSGKNVTYHIVDGMSHCDLGSFPEYRMLYLNSIIDACK